MLENSEIPGIKSQRIKKMLNSIEFDSSCCSFNEEERKREQILNLFITGFRDNTDDKSAILDILGYICEYTKDFTRVFHNICKNGFLMDLIAYVQSADFDFVILERSLKIISHIICSDFNQAEVAIDSDFLPFCISLMDIEDDNIAELFIQIIDSLISKHRMIPDSVSIESLLGKIHSCFSLSYDSFYYCIRIILGITNNCEIGGIQSIYSELFLAIIDSSFFDLDCAFLVTEACISIIKQSNDSMDSFLKSDTMDYLFSLANSYSKSVIHTQFFVSFFSLLNESLRKDPESSNFIRESICDELIKKCVFTAEFPVVVVVLEFISFFIENNDQSIVELCINNNIIDSLINDCFETSFEAKVFSLKLIKTLITHNRSKLILDLLLELEFIEKGSLLPGNETIDHDYYDILYIMYQIADTCYDPNVVLIQIQNTLNFDNLSPEFLSRLNIYPN